MAIRKRTDASNTNQNQEQEKITIQPAPYPMEPKPINEPVQPEYKPRNPEPSKLPSEIQQKRDAAFAKVKEMLSAHQKKMSEVQEQIKNALAGGTANNVNNPNAEKLARLRQLLQQRMQNRGSGQNTGQNIGQAINAEKLAQLRQMMQQRIQQRQQQQQAGGVQNQGQIQKQLLLELLRRKGLIK